MEIYISSGRHILTDVEKRIESIEHGIGEPDAVFFEDRVSNCTKKDKLSNWVAAPMLLAFLSFWPVIIGNIFPMFVQTDKEIVEHFQEEYGLEPYLVDKPFHEIIGSQRRSWFLASWALLFIPVAFATLFQFGLKGVFFILFSLITGTISIILAYFSAVHAERNVYIISKIIEIAEISEYEKACIITGEKHESDLRELVRQSDEIKLANNAEN